MITQQLKFRAFDAKGNEIDSNQLRTLMILSLAQEPEKLEDGEQWIIINTQGSFEIISEVLQ